MAMGDLNLSEAADIIISNADSAIFTVSAGVTSVDASKRTKAIEITGNNGNNSITGGKVSDTLSGGSGNDTLTGGSGSDMFIYTSGDDFITDFAPAQDKIKILNDTLKSVEIEDEEFVVLNFESGGTLTLQGAVKKGKPQKITIIDANDVTTSQIYGTESVNISNSDGSTIDARINPAVENISAANRSKAVNIIGNDNDNSIKGGSGADTLDGGEFSYDTLTGGKGADVFIYTGGDDVITDYNPDQGDVIRFVGVEVDTYSFEDDAVIFETDGGDLRILDGKAKPITWISDIGKTHVKSYISSDEIVFSKDDTLTVFDASVTLYRRKVGIDASRLTKVKGITITGNSNDNIIKGSSGNDSIYGLTGYNTITGGKGKDTIVHDKGNDVIMDYTPGQDLIKIKSTNTSLVGASVSADEDTGEETDIVFTFSNRSTITVKNAIKISNKGKKSYQKITIVDGSGTSTTKTYAVDSINLTNNSGTSFNANSPFNVDLVTINASRCTKPISIYGNDKGNIITGGSKDDIIVAGSKASTLNGGAGNDYVRGGGEGDSINGGRGNDSLFGYAGDDTIIGGAGNDTMYGGSGKDVFFYTSGDGNDVIMDYSSGDIIQLGKNTTIKSAARSGTDFVLNVGKNNITVRNIGTTAIKVVNYKGNEKTYDSTKSYTERFYMEEPWFVENDVNIVNSYNKDNNDLSSILQSDADNSAVTSEILSTPDYSNLFNNNTFENVQVISNKSNATGKKS